MATDKTIADEDDYSGGLFTYDMYFRIIANGISGKYHLNTLGDEFLNFLSPLTFSYYHGSATIDATNYALTSDGSSPSEFNIVRIHTNATVYSIDARIIGKNTDDSNAESIIIDLKAAVRRDGLGAISIIGTPTVTVIASDTIFTGLEAGITLTTDDTNQGIYVIVAGSADHPMQWQTWIITREIN